MPTTGSVLYQSFFEPAPVPTVDVFNGGVLGNGNVPPRGDTRRRRPVAEGMSYVDPSAAIDLVVTQMDWDFQFPDAIARRKRLVNEGLAVLDLSANFAAEVITLDKWAGRHQDRNTPRKRATYEGLEEVEPIGWQAEIASEMRWRGAHADAVARRRAPVREGLEGIDPAAGVSIIVETITADKWIGNWPDRLYSRKRASYEGMWASNPPSYDPDIASSLKWRGMHADAVARRKRPVGEGLSANVFTEVFIVPTLDRWAPTYPDRYRKRPVPVREGAFSFYPEPITTAPNTRWILGEARYTSIVPGRARYTSTVKGAARYTPRVYGRGRIERG